MRTTMPPVEANTTIGIYLIVGVTFVWSVDQKLLHPWHSLPAAVNILTRQTDKQSASRIN